jgi:Xaa-Pro aminopeptidase
MTPDHAARRDRVRAALREQHGQATALLVTDLTNVRYLTGFTGSAGTLLLGTDPASDRLATDGRYAEQAATETPDLPLIITRERTWLRDVGATPGTPLAVERTLAWGAVLDLGDLLGEEVLTPADGLVEQARATKDPAELARLGEACQIAGDAFLATLEHIRPGVTELDVAHRLERTMVDFGAAERAFPSIVASGPNGARPHHRPGDRILRRGDLITMDFGALVDGYRSDMTRLVALGGLPDELRSVTRAVARAQQRARETVRAGVSAGDVDAAARSSLTEAGYGDAFVHGTGHGLGLGLHETPFLANGASATLRDRMVVTVEPGVYLPGLGGARIEDAVVVGPDGADILTTVPRDVFVL